MILVKYNDFAIQHGENYNKGNNFGHLKIGGLQVCLSLLVTPIDMRSSHGWLAFLDNSNEPLCIDI